jgi:AraC family transcriptional regulator of adaptative response/methylated-DNA-[protein]-cysteine methyltransferase
VYEDVGRLGMKPKTMQAGGAGETIKYAVAESALGKMLVAATERGVCAVSFGDTDAALLKELRGRYGKAELVRDDAALTKQVKYVAGHLGENHAAAELPLDVRATAFQERVWKELRKIPRGETRTYAQIAEKIGRPKAFRAVGAAIGSNPLALIVPCHRVVGSDGKLAGYHWGVERKKRLLAAEAR